MGECGGYKRGDVRRGWVGGMVEVGKSGGIGSPPYGYKRGETGIGVRGG